VDEDGRSLRVEEGGIAPHRLGGDSWSDGQEVEATGNGPVRSLGLGLCDDHIMHPTLYTSANHDHCARQDDGPRKCPVVGKLARRGAGQEITGRLESAARGICWYQGLASSLY
jgi:hypothetical protein